MLVLYRELAGYFVNSMNYLAEKHKVNIDIIAYPVKSDAPFRFEFSEFIRVYERDQVTQEDIIRMIDEQPPNLIFCGGWSDKEYLSAIKKRPHIPALLGFDKQWLGSLKDFAASAYLRLKVRPLFDYAFVPGEQQAQFARAMGFKNEEIFKGAYTCETKRFQSIYNQRQTRTRRVEKKLVYAGRYASEKDIQNLWNVFVKLRAENKLTKWSLHCIGTGPLYDQRVMHDSIVHHGFLQGKKMDEIMIDADVFILPSIYEPWGVVVNEFALSGYPLILSSAVGATTALLEGNGILFKSGDANDLENALQQMDSWSDQVLTAFSEKSHRLSSVLDEEQYAKSILKMMKK